MQKAAGTLFTVGKVLMIIEIVFCALALCASIYGVTNSEEVYQELINQGSTDFASAAEVQALFATLLAVLAIAIIFDVIVMIFASKAKMALGNGDKKPQIIALVLSIISGSIFYIIASIFGLVLATKANNTQPQEPQVQ